MYLDDILVASRSHEDHQEHLKRFFSLLSSNGLVLNKAKRLFGVEKLDFLGHQVSAGSISPLPHRVTALPEHPAPKDHASLQRFLGLINYYHHFIPHVAGLLAPLHAQASGKGQSITWSNDCQVVFKSIKEAQSHVILLHHPRPDAQTSLTVHASSTALGAQLEQRKGKDWQPIAFFSSKLSTAEVKYSAFDRELLGAYAAIKHFRHFLEGREFTLYTDHKPLTTAVNSQSDRPPRQTRHLSYISEFTTDIQHVQGKHNVVADALSRLSPVFTPEDEENSAVNASDPVTSIHNVMHGYYAWFGCHILHIVESLNLFLPHLFLSLSLSLSLCLSLFNYFLFYFFLGGRRRGRCAATTSESRSVRSSASYSILFLCCFSV